MQRDLTTREVARICQLSPQTVLRMANDGSLPCYRVPCSTHRRIRPAALRRFMATAGIPTTWLDHYLAHRKDPYERTH